MASWSFSAAHYICQEVSLDFLAVISSSLNTVTSDLSVSRTCEPWKSRCLTSAATSTTPSRPTHNIFKVTCKVYDIIKYASRLYKITFAFRACVHQHCFPVNREQWPGNRGEYAMSCILIDSLLMSKQPLVTRKCHRGKRQP